MKPSGPERFNPHRLVLSALAVVALHMVLAQVAMLAYARLAPGVPDRGMVSLPELPRVMLSATGYLGGSAIWAVLIMACVAFAAPSFLCVALFRDRWSGSGAAAGLCIILLWAMVVTMRAAESFAKVQAFLGYSASPRRYLVNHLAVVLASVASGLVAGAALRRIAARSPNPALQPTPQRRRG